jgi:hypothetical protein
VRLQCVRVAHVRLDHRSKRANPVGSAVLDTRMSPITDAAYRIGLWPFGPYYAGARLGPDTRLPPNAVPPFVGFRDKRDPGKRRCCQAGTAQRHREHLAAALLTWGRMR